MPDHHLRSYFWYIVDHPQLLKDGSDADTNNVNKTVMRESEHAASSGGALSLLGSITSLEMRMKMCFQLY
jgi:hypothetical protein